jgi:transcriptional regulator with XRE-family HTH domain
MPPGRAPSPDESVAFVAANVRYHRLRCGLTQEALAELADVPPLRVQRIERGQADVRVRTLVGLARALGIPVSSLFRARRPAPRETGRPKSKGRRTPTSGR